MGLFVGASVGDATRLSLCPSQSSLALETVELPSRSTSRWTKTFPPCQVRLRCSAWENGQARAIEDFVCSAFGCPCFPSESASAPSLAFDPFP